MPFERLDFAEPFFSVRHIDDEPVCEVDGRAILLNIGATPIRIRDQELAPLQSVIVANHVVEDIERGVIVDGFSAHPSEQDLLARIRRTWPSAYAVRGEERLKGVEHFMSPKVWVRNIGLTMYHSASVPLKVGLHREHPFCPAPGFREVHTQIVGFGKMQQCGENDVSTLYLEEPMAPGATHRPMYDADGNHPWHQYETTTPSVFLAVEMLPPGVQPPH